MKNLLIFTTIFIMVILAIYWYTKNNISLPPNDTCLVNYTEWQQHPDYCYYNTTVGFSFGEKGIWVETLSDALLSSILVNVSSYKDLYYNQMYIYIKNGHYYSMFINNKDVKVDKIVRYSKINTKTKELVIYNNKRNIPQEERHFFGLK